jgi:hypothetical protein
VIVELAPGFLSWDEVDPARHRFDGASAVQVVHSLGPARCVPRRPDVPFADLAMSAWSHGEAKLWADAMSHALVQHYGRWTVGLRWAHDEGDFDGGPVGNWCCPRDSITTPEETLARVVAALCEWRGWLESLAGWFEAYPLELTDVGDQRILWERAARNLILQVTDRTGCGSGWHGHCRQVLTWFLSRWGVAPDAAQDLVDQAIGGRFLSWTGPDMALVEDIAERLALSLRPDDSTQRACLQRHMTAHWETRAGSARKSRVSHTATAEPGDCPTLSARPAPRMPARRRPSSARMPWMVRGPYTVERGAALLAGGAHSRYMESTAWAVAIRSSACNAGPSARAPRGDRRRPGAASSMPAAKTGTCTRWTPKPASNAGLSPPVGKVISSPVVDDSTVYVGSHDKNVYAVQT